MTILDPLDDLEFTLGRLDGRRVWFVSDGTVVPYVGGGDGDDDTDDDDHADGADDRDDQDDADDDGDGDEDSGDSAELRKWKREKRKWEKRAKDNRRELERLRNRGSNSSDDDHGDEQVREQVRSEERTRFASRSVEMYLDAQVEAGRITDEQADGLLDSIDPTKFIDDDGDVDTDKVKGLLKVIAKPAKGTEDDGTKRRLDSGQGRRQGTQRRGEKRGSVASGRELYEQLHGKKTG